MIFQVTAGTKQSWNGASRVMARLGIALSVVALVAGGEARAQDLEPRAYVDTPVGMNFLIASYAYSEGGVSTDPSRRVGCGGRDLLSRRAHDDKRHVGK